MSAHRRRCSFALATLLASTLVLVTLAGETLASASGSIPPPTYSHACEKSATTQLALDRCAASELAALKPELIHALNIEGGVLGRAQVTATEQKWVAFESSECSLESAPYAGGTIEPLIYTDCERDLVVARIDEIRAVVAAARHA